MSAARQILTQMPMHSRSRTVVAGRAFSSYSSFFEPDPTLFNVRESKLGKPAPDDAELRDDVRTMGSLLGNIILKGQGKDIFDKVEKLRHLAKVSLSPATTTSSTCAAALRLTSFLSILRLGERPVLAEEKKPSSKRLPRFWRSYPLMSALFPTQSSFG